jgi:hypothetical protein
MKPNEYLFNEAINSVENRKKDFYLGLLEYNEFGENISTYKFNRKQEKELDKRFIDREELKDKINDIDIWHKNGLQLKKEILELLK